MTPTTLRECLENLSWSQRGLAHILQCNDRLVRRWASGESQIPDEVAAWLLRLTACFRENPPPDSHVWRKRSLTAKCVPGEGDRGGGASDGIERSPAKR